MLRPRHLPLSELQASQAAFTAFWIPAAFFISLGAVWLMLIPVGTELLWINNHRSVFADHFFQFATLLGEGWAFLAVSLLLLFFRWKAALTLPLLGFLVTVVAQLSKHWFAHDRPYPYLSKLGIWEQLQPIEGVELLQGANSFPSGHTMAAFALYTFAALNMPRRWWLGMSFALLAVLTAFSRMYLLHHFLKDVVVGGLTGIALALLWHYLLLWLWKEERSLAAG